MGLGMPTINGAGEVRLGVPSSVGLRVPWSMGC